MNTILPQRAQSSDTEVTELDNLTDRMAEMTTDEFAATVFSFFGGVDWRLKHNSATRLSECVEILRCNVERRERLRRARASVSSALALPASVPSVAKSKWI